MTGLAEVAAPTIVVGDDGTMRSRDAIELAYDLAQITGADVRTEHVPENPAAGLSALAFQSAAQFLVVGSTHRVGFHRVFPGAVAERLFRAAPCPVAIAPSGYASLSDRGVRVIAAAYDGSHESAEAVKLGAALALAARCTIRLLSVIESIPAGLGRAPGTVTGVGVSNRSEVLRGQLTTVRDALPAELRADARLLKGDVTDEVLKEAEYGVDLLFMGSRGAGRIDRALLGSVATDVTRRAHCPVVVVPTTALPAAHAGAERDAAPAAGGTK